jgi:hypothetical protein
MTKLLTAILLLTSISTFASAQRECIDINNERICATVEEIESTSTSGVYLTSFDRAVSAHSADSFKINLSKKVASKLCNYFSRHPTDKVLVKTEKMVGPALVLTGTGGVDHSFGDAHKVISAVTCLSF